MKRRVCSLPLLMQGTALAAVFCLVAQCNPAPQTPPTLTDPPRTIISVVPSATEMIFAFGLGDKVIAVGDYDRFPPEVQAKPKIGGLLNPNVEKIIELKPDLIVIYGSQEGLRGRLKAVGIRFHPFSHGNAEETLQYMLELGRVVGAAQRADEIVAEIRRTFDEIRAHRPATRPRVLLVHNRGAGLIGSFYTVGNKAFQHELIELAGGENLFGDVDRETLQPSIEEVMKRAPDIIIETLPPPVDPREALQRRKDWESLGLAHGRIHIVGESYFLVSGPRLNLAAKGFAEIIQQTK